MIFFFAFPILSGKFGKQSLRFRAAKLSFLVGLRSRVGQPQVRSFLRSGVPEKIQVRSGLRSGSPRDLDLRPGPDRSIFGPPSFFFKCGAMEEDQERDSSSDEERPIIQDEDMEDSATDIPELWIPDRNDEDTKFVRGQGDAGVPVNTQVRPGLRSGVPEKPQVRSGLRSGGPRDLRPDLRPDR